MSCITETGDDQWEVSIANNDGFLPEEDNSTSDRAFCKKCNRWGPITMFYSTRYKKQMLQCEECRAQRREYKRKVDGYYERRQKKEEEAKAALEAKQALLKGITELEEGVVQWI